MSTTYDAIVIGGGVVGAATAYHLAKAGAQTLLVDRNDPSRATNAGAGILAPELTGGESDEWFNFGVKAVGYYPHLVAALAETGAGDTSYAVCGKLMVAVDEDEMAAFAQARERILSRQQRRGRPATTDLHDVTPGEAREHFPALAEVRAAMWYSGAARVDGRYLAAALHHAATYHGLVSRAAGVQQLQLQQGRVNGVLLADGEALAANRVIIAGGAWSAQFGEQLGIQIPVEPQRGQIIHWDMAPAATGTWPIINAFHGHYIVCWPNGRVVTGATRESDSGFADDTSAIGMREVIDEGLRVAPGLARARFKEVRVGLRPFSPVDGLPILGTVPGVEGIVLATGHGPTGLQLGPYSGQIAADLALGRQVTEDIQPFRVDRF
ncbi:MAG: FAD-binding oxidoreductase [Caldilineaceae bacterium]